MLGADLQQVIQQVIRLRPVKGDRLVAADDQLRRPVDERTAQGPFHLMIKGHGAAIVLPDGSPIRAVCGAMGCQRGRTWG